LRFKTIFVALRIWHLGFDSFVVAKTDWLFTRFWFSKTLGIGFAFQGLVCAWLVA